jgi:hypothetical protein
MSNDRIKELEAQRDVLLRSATDAQLMRLIDEADPEIENVHLATREDLELLFKGCYESLNHSIPKEVL